MKCTGCGYEIQFEKALFCPECGKKTAYGENSNNVKNSDGEVCPDISHIWPEWHLEKRLGKGSYGTVYQAVRKDSGIVSRAAIKIISIPSDNSEIRSLRGDGLDHAATKEYFKSMVNDFVEEIRLMDTFKGVQNIVSVEDYKVVEKADADIGWDIYIRMELLTPFDSYISDKKLTEAEVIRLGMDIATALEICSKKNVIHRDIKPENIFINDFGYFKLGDFGIARKLEGKSIAMSQKGTYNYMAPEVAHSEKYDTGADLYSLSVMLYKLMNDNKLPFLPADKQIFTYAERENAVTRRLRGDAISPPCNASPALAKVILKGCSFRCEERFSDATEMKKALEDVLKGTDKERVTVENDPDKTVAVKRGQKNEPDKTVAVKRGQKNEPEQDTDNSEPFRYEPSDSLLYGGSNAGKNQTDKTQRNKSYVSIVAIAIALGLLTGLLAGGIILLVKFSSGEFSLHIDTLQNSFIPFIREIITWFSV